MQHWAVMATYDAWLRMRNRCLNPKDKDWHNYGGRGVTICPQWLTSFQTFLKDVGPKPERSRLLWLGRLDLDGNYTPENVAWLRHQRQISHRRYCHRIPVGGQAMTIQEAGPVIGLPAMTLRRRLLVRRLDLSEAVQLGRMPYRRDSKFLTHDGQTLSVPEWAKKLGIRVRTLRERIQRGDPSPLTPGLRRSPTRYKTASPAPSAP